MTDIDIDAINEAASAIRSFCIEHEVESKGEHTPDPVVHSKEYAVRALQAALPALIAASLRERDKRIAELEEANDILRKRVDWTVADNAKKAIQIADLRAALAFYADPFSQKDEFGEPIPVPDFYSELGFGDTASDALATLGETDG